MNSTTEAFEKLLQIMNDLRDKCPWDKKQTIATLRPLTIEETYELCDAIDDNDYKGIKEELGDLFLHLVFYANIGTEKNAFTLTDVLEGINKKLIDRHPHIYGNVVAATEDDVKNNWEKLKMKEGKTSVLGGVPKALPAIIKATRIQEKAKQTGFEWDNKADVWKKVEEEMNELKEAESTENKENIEEEFGDLLFSLVNYARFLHIDAETALEKTNKKFISRFMKMEAEALKANKKLDEMTLDEMDQIWNQVKLKMRE
jgi:MazG family protein